MRKKASAQLYYWSNEGELVAGAPDLLLGESLGVMKPNKVEGLQSRIKARSEGSTRNDLTEERHLAM